MDTRVQHNKRGICIYILDFFNSPRFLHQIFSIILNGNLDVTTKGRGFSERAFSWFPFRVTGSTSLDGLSKFYLIPWVVSTKAQTIPNSFPHLEISEGQQYETGNTGVPPHQGKQSDGCSFNKQKFEGGHSNGYYRKKKSKMQMQSRGLSPYCLGFASPVVGINALPSGRIPHYPKKKKNLLQVTIHYQSPFTKFPKKA